MLYRQNSNHLSISSSEHLHSKPATVFSKQNSAIESTEFCCTNRFLTTNLYQAGSICTRNCKSFFWTEFCYTINKILLYRQNSNHLSISSSEHIHSRTATLFLTEFCCTNRFLTTCLYQAGSIYTLNCNTFIWTESCCRTDGILLYNRLNSARERDLYYILNRKT
jgi:hypothetical protein